jgi:hypothetical protein
MDELKAMIAENLAKLKAIQKPEQTEFADGYKMGYELAMAHVLAMLEGKGSAAAVLGARGGKSTSEAKKAAAVANGKKGGRPRKAHQRADPLQGGESPTLRGLTR